MTKIERASDWIAFDQVEIDLAGRRLFVAGAETPLEPKAFAVLALLARNPIQALTRDAILDTVWGHRHVTPGVLNRVVTLLRQALGESAGAAQYLHTLHGVGYRFDAQVRIGATRAEVGGRSAVPDSTTAAPPVTAFDTGALAAGEGAPVDAPAPTASTPPNRPATQTSSPRLAPRAGHAWLVALALTALLVAAYLLSGRPTPAPASKAPTLVVLPLRPVGAAQDEDVFAQGLSEELITRLARIEGLHLISRTSAALAQSDKLDLSQLAERLHVTHALEGSLRQAGQQLRIDLRLVEIPGGRALWAQNYDRGLADVFAIESEIAKSVAGALTLKLGLADTSVERDPLLLRDYLELRHRLFEHPNQPEYGELIVSLRAFVARAPEYARAHGLLARALVRELRAGTVTEAESAEAAREAARALELDPDQIEAHATLATLACRATEWPRCMDEFHRILELAPAESAWRAAYGRWLAGIGYLDQALAQIELGTASDPLNFEASLFRARVLDTMGRHAQARDAFDTTDRLKVDTQPQLAYAHWYNAIWRGDLAAAREFVADMPSDEAFHDAYLAATQALLDPARWPQVEPLIEASERATGRYNFLRLLQPDPDFAKIASALESVLKTGSSSYNLLVWNREYAALRRDPAFQDFLRRTRILDYWRSNGWPPQCRADGERAVCD